VVLLGDDLRRVRRVALEAALASWIAGAPPRGHEDDFGAKTRYRQSDAACELKLARDDSFSLGFPTPQWAVTPGQSAVVYRADECLGGGVIR
jgi:tRNA-specific 2-thiouridylase